MEVYSRRDSHTVLTLLVIAFLGALVQGCGSALQLASRWNDHSVRIDGNLNDWSDSTVFVEKDDFRLGMMNDDEFLYLCLTGSKPEIGRQVLFRGITVWFDPNGGEKKTFGVRFPIGMGRIGMPFRSGRENTEGRASRFEPDASQALGEFEFFGPTENDRQRVSRLQGQGLELDLKTTAGTFIYELKIPLVFSSRHPYALETRPGATIGVGVESNVPEVGTMSERGAGSRGGGTGGGRPGIGGGRGGRTPGTVSPGGSRPGMGGETFRFWSYVRLAEKAR
ncbi:MAG: hypothetical protein AABZ02_15130 [Bacteroidota bacterium]